MKNYVIITDSSADLTPQLAEQLGVEVLPMGFSIDGTEYLSYPDERELSAQQLYHTLRTTKATVHTSQVNPGTMQEVFSSHLAAGCDVLYLAFSSGLSGTYQSAAILAEELAEAYPDRRLYVVDSRCACVGLAALVMECCARRDVGADISAVYQWAQENKQRICHWLTVDDLNHLYRGGRLSAASAMVGTALGIKPIICIDEDGRLIPKEKVRGRSNVFAALCKHLEDADDLTHSTVYITHGGCPEDADQLERHLRANYQVGNIVRSQIGPVVGCHAGPGALALVFFGTRR